MPARKPDPEAGKEISPILALFRQYLSRFGNNTSKPKTVYVQKMNVDVKKSADSTGAPKTKTKKREKKTDADIAPEIEKSLQQYISRRSAFLSRAATNPKRRKKGAAMPPATPQPVTPATEQKKEAPGTVTPSAASERAVGQFAEIKKDEPQQLTAGQMAALRAEESPLKSLRSKEPPALPQASGNRPGWVLRFLQYLPTFSQNLMAATKKTEELSEKVKKSEAEAHEMASRLQETERRLAGAQMATAKTKEETPKTVEAMPELKKVEPPKTEVKKELPKPTLPPPPPPPPAPSAEESRKKMLENEEKKAEVLMMKAAKNITPKKQGVFQQMITSLEYIGLGKQQLLIIQNLATMLGAGLPLIDALHTLLLEAKNRSVKKLLHKIIVSVDNGTPLWRAMEETNFFSPHAIALIRIGEEAGNLAENMRYLAEQQEKDQALREKVKMAMIYPTIVMILMIIIVLGLGLFVLPQLIGVLKNLNVPLPLITVLLINFTDAFTTYAYIAIPAVFGFFIFIAALAKFTRFKIITQWITFKIPGIGKLAREATLARFGVIMGGLLQAGVPLVEALNSLVEVTPTVAFKNFYKKLLDHVNTGDSFGRSFTVIRGTDKILPISIQQLIVTGEKTGSLAQIMLKIADIYEKEANNTAQKLPVILEPVILLCIGALVGTIAFAIIIPIYSIVGNVSGATSGGR